MDVICVGGATIDVFVLLHKLKDFNYDKFSNQISFPLGGKIPLDEYKLALGGNACNVSVGLSRLGIKTSLVAQVGTDEFAQRIRKSLSDENVDTSLLSDNPARNDHFNIILSFEGERTIIEEKTTDNTNLNSPDSNPDLIYLTSISNDWKMVYESAISKNPRSRFALNPGPRQIEEAHELISVLSKMEILFVNFQEAQKIIGEDLTDIKGILSKLKNFGVKIAAITDGRNGSYSIDSGGKCFKINTASERRPIERTGAGDAYATGFIYAYLNGKEIRECMKIASINADCVIEKIGSQEGLISQSRLEQIYSGFENLVAEEI